MFKKIVLSGTQIKYGRMSLIDYGVQFYFLSELMRYYTSDSRDLVWIMENNN